VHLGVESAEHGGHGKSRGGGGDLPHPERQEGVVTRPVATAGAVRHRTAPQRQLQAGGRAGAQPGNATADPDTPDLQLDRHGVEHERVRSLPGLGALEHARGLVAQPLGHEGAAGRERQRSGQPQRLGGRGRSRGRGRVGACCGLEQPLHGAELRQLVELEGFVLGVRRVG
jgi:hypothetical protein